MRTRRVPEEPQTIVISARMPHWQLLDDQVRMRLRQCPDNCINVSHLSALWGSLSTYIRGNGNPRGAFTVRSTKLELTSAPPASARTLSSRKREKCSRSRTTTCNR